MKDYGKRARVNIYKAIQSVGQARLDLVMAGTSIPYEHRQRASEVLGLLEGIHHALVALKNAEGQNAS